MVRLERDRAATGGAAEEVLKVDGEVVLAVVKANRSSPRSRVSWKIRSRGPRLRRGRRGLLLVRTLRERALPVTCELPKVRCCEGSPGWFGCCSIGAVSLLDCYAFERALGYGFKDQELMGAHHTKGE